MIVEEIDTVQSTRIETERRRNHPIFKPFWDIGEKLLARERISSIPDITPYSSAQRNMRIATAQIACSRNMNENISKIKS